MKVNLLICLSILVLATKFQDAASAPQSATCYDANTKHRWAAGTEYHPIGQCVNLRCSPQGQKMAVTCPVVQQPAAGCSKVGSDLRRSYPDCCPKYNCAG